MLQFIRNRKISLRTKLVISESSSSQGTVSESKRDEVSTTFDSLVSLFNHEAWQLALQVLSSHHLDCHLEYSDYRMSNGDTIVHLACRKYPSYEIIEKLIQVFPDSLSTSNKEDQFPIHVAVHHGAHPIVIDYMTQCSASSLKKRDSHGRAPLHIACAFYSESYKNTTGMFAYSKSSATSKVIKILVRKGASVVNVEDNDGYSALEYAIISNTDIDAIHLLQKYCLRNWKGAYMKRKLLNANAKQSNLQNHL